jgi:hypothetical protein
MSDTDYTDKPVCPFCGYEVDDTCELDHSENGDIIECGECEREFYYEASISVSWSTRPLKPCAHLDDHGMNCSWEPGDRFSYPDVECRPCAYRDHQRAEALALCVSQPSAWEEGL